MNEEPRKDEGIPGVALPAQPNHTGDSTHALQSVDPAAAANKSTCGGDPPISADQPAAPSLTREEQWALFEKELKENDWGHQPC